MIVIASTQRKSYDENMKIFNELRDSKPCLIIIEMLTSDNCLSFSVDNGTIDETIKICDDLVNIYDVKKATICFYNVKLN